MKKIVILPVILILFSVVVLADTWIHFDFNDDEIVNSQDLSILAMFYGSTDCSDDNNWCNGTDVNRDNNVNLLEVSEFAKYYGCNWNSTNETGCWE